ncbi:MAG: GNAT family N-acetyltransferase [Bacteroidota bacterium]
MIEIVKFNSHNDVLYRQALEIRKTVFIDEQRVPVELEVENEEQATYYLMLLHGKAIGTARRRDTAKGIKLERFAVLPGYRNKAYGTSMLEEVLEDLRQSDRPVYLHSQINAVKYYERQGFVRQGEIFEEAGILHYTMVLQ